MEYAQSSETYLRDWVDYFVRTNGNTTILHLPADSSTPNEPAPLCGRVLNNWDTEWISKPVQVYPPGFAPICKRCREELEHQRTQVIESD